MVVYFVCFWVPLKFFSPCGLENMPHKPHPYLALKTSTAAYEMHVVKTQRFSVGANGIEGQEVKQIQFRESYGDIDGLCYEHRPPLPPANPSLTTPC